MPPHPLTARRFLRLFPCLAALLVTACTPAARTPIATLSFQPPGKAAQRTLLVLLPGRGGTLDNYQSEGLVDEVRRLRLPIDLLAADAHFGYYAAGTLPARLREDVIVPARRRGYQRIWLVGISMGGTGALWYDRVYPGEVDGLILLSPYLGEPEMVAEVAQAGGLARWEPPPGKGDLPHALWRLLSDYREPANSRRRVYLGWGLADRFAEADALLAAVLPPGQTSTAPGAHDWPTWRVLWPLLLETAFRGATAEARIP